MATQTSNPQAPSRQSLPDSIWWLIGVVVLVLLVLGGIEMFDSDGRGLPPNGTVETMKDSLDFYRSIAEGRGISTGAFRKDFISFPTKLVKGVWSNEVDLFSLNPFRYKWDVSVSDSVRVRFRDGFEITVTPKDSLKAGRRPAIMRFLAFRDSATVVPSAWNQ
jgi:hypothetical protein